MLPLLLLLLAAGPAAPPDPVQRDYVEDVRVTARAPESVRSGIVQVRVVGPDGQSVHGLGAADFRLNRGEVEIAGAAEVRAQPAVLIAVDLTSAPWRAAKGAPESTTPALARGLARRLAREWPEGKTAIALLDGVGLQQWKLDGVPGEQAWAVNGELAQRLAASPGDPFARPLAPFKTLFDKRLHERLAGACSALSGWRLAENQHFVLFVGDGFAGAPQVAYRLVRQADSCSLWPRDSRLADEARLQRAFLADRAFPLIVSAPPRKSAELDLFDLGRCAEEPTWTRAPSEDSRRLAVLAQTVEGASVAAGSRGDAEVADWAVAQVRERLDFYWIAWRTPEHARIGESFMKVDVVNREGTRVVPDRIGGQLLLRQDPYLAPYVGPLEDLPSRFRPVLGR